MKVQAIRPFWLGEKMVKVGDVVDVSSHLAAEMISVGKAVSPAEPAERKAAKAEAEPAK
jgi:hypothetical protein